MELNDFFKENPRAALAFSGGTDSAYLLYICLLYTSYNRKSLSLEPALSLNLRPARPAI